MLRADGIEVRITNDRSYRGQRRSHFSYRVDEEAPAPKPAVWIINADEQPRARQLLREAGLLDSSRDGASSYLPLSALDDPASSAQEKKAKRKVRIRLGLLVVILVAIGFTIFGTRTPSPAVPAVATPKPAPPRPADIIPQSAEELSGLSRRCADRAGEAAGRGRTGRGQAHAGLHRHRRPRPVARLPAIARGRQHHSVGRRRLRRTARRGSPCATT
jgi:hypothetical protein